MKLTNREEKRVLNAVTLQPDSFGPYVHYLSSLLEATSREGPLTKQQDLALALDGQPRQELRKLYATDELRETGTYFTGSKLANRLVTPIAPLLPHVTQVIDPACGAGDLLVACARHLPVRQDAAATLREWGRRLSGFDTNSAFIQTTKYRLALLAYDRCGRSDSTTLPLNEIFERVELRSGLSDWKFRDTPSVIVVNPPFAYGVAEKGCTWAEGRVSQAATFMDRCLRNAPRGTRILAILPDVLRTGTRYRKWRMMIQDKARINAVEIVGPFDETTDVNVFLLDLEAGSHNDTDRIGWAHPKDTTERSVKDLFSIHVGPVVPFRLNGKGRWCAYIHSEQLPPWEKVRTISQHIRFTGTTYKPPFVVIRRTSKADYQIRCVGTLVAGTAPVAVENHLLIALPYDKKVRTCKKLLHVLKLESTSAWMNERIRCRHLTVGSVADLPWPGDE